MLIDIIILVIIGVIAYWIITTFFPEPIRMIALVVVGLGLLLWLLNIVGLLGHVPARLIN